MMPPPECSVGQSPGGAPQSSNEVVIPQTEDIFATMETFIPPELSDTGETMIKSGSVFETPQVTNSQVYIYCHFDYEGLSEWFISNL